MVELKPSFHLSSNVSLKAWVDLHLVSNIYSHLYKLTRAHVYEELQKVRKEGMEKKKKDGI
jgi:hypothetical protein